MGRPERVPDSWFWLDAGAIDGDRVRLSREESRHLVRVFRAAAGARFEATDGAGTLYRCVLENAAAEGAVARIESRAPRAGELPFSVRLVVGLPDPAQVERLVEQGTALGAGRVTFLTAARSGPGRLGGARIGRLERIARAALKQSRRTLLPELRYAEALAEALPEAAGRPPGDKGAWRLLADPGGSAALPEELPDLQCPVLLSVGPPGGFLEGETSALEGLGFRRIALGPSRLSTSTAALCLLAWVRNHLLSKGLGQFDKTPPPGYLH